MNVFQVRLLQKKSINIRICRISVKNIHGFFLTGVKTNNNKTSKNSNRAKTGKIIFHSYV